MVLEGPLFFIILIQNSGISFDFIIDQSFKSLHHQFGNHWPLAKVPLTRFPIAMENRLYGIPKGIDSDTVCLDIWSVVTSR